MEISKYGCKQDATTSPLNPMGAPSPGQGCPALIIIIKREGDDLQFPQRFLESALCSHSRAGAHLLPLSGEIRGGDVSPRPVVFWGRSLDYRLWQFLGFPGEAIFS